MGSLNAPAQDFVRRTQLQFLNVNEILILSVQRTTYDRQTNQDKKILDPIDIGGDLEIQLQSGEKETFSLISAIEHIG